MNISEKIGALLASPPADDEVCIVEMSRLLNEARKLLKESPTVRFSDCYIDLDPKVYCALVREENGELLLPFKGATGTKVLVDKSVPGWLIEFSGMTVASAPKAPTVRQSAAALYSAYREAARKDPSDHTEEERRLLELDPGVLRELKGED